MRREESRWNYGKTAELEKNGGDGGEGGGGGGGKKTVV